MTSARGRLPALVWIALACTASAAVHACDAPRTRPNVLVILVDDLGYGDLGTFGREDFLTPHIDRIAAEGTRFTRHYSDSTCAPSRAALLGGRHPARAGFRPRGRGLPQEWTTLAELLQRQGYATRHIGKWHLGGTGILGLDASPASALPSAQGFDHWFGFLESRLLQGPTTRGASSVWEYGPARYASPWLLGSEERAAIHEGHLTDLLTDRAVAFLRDAGDAPWLLNLWTFAVHGPVEPAVRFARRHPPTRAGRHAALLEQLDENVGRVLDVLAETGQDERTLVVFLSDNGGALVDDPSSNLPFAGRKGQYREGGTRVPLALRWPGRIPEGGVVEAPVSILDVYPTVAALVGAEAPRDLDGRDLTPLLRGEALPLRPLFFEQRLPNGDTRYSVVSGDGRFRLARRGAGAPVLFDLDADAAGALDVHASHPEAVARLTRLYLDWRRDTLRTRVSVTDTDDAGRGVAVGDDLQRSPGWAGFTFAIGVGLAAQPPGTPTEQVVAHQQDLWELVRTPGDALRLRIADAELSSAPLAGDRCHPVVFTAYFHRSLRNPSRNGATLELWVDGALRASERTRSLPAPSDLAAPTGIGRAAAGGRGRFQGRLSAPAFLNDQVGNAPDAAVTIASLGEEVCPAPEPR